MRSILSFVVLKSMYIVLCKILEEILTLPLAKEVDQRWILILVLKSFLCLLKTFVAFLTICHYDSGCREPGITLFAICRL